MTPKELMKSRYEAFVREDWAYLAQTSTTQTIEDLSSMPKLQWLKLEIIESYDNVVEFKAYYKENGIVGVLHEKSFFIQEDGIVKYDTGIIYQTKIQRNEPCPCGSGKKFKKCCAL